MLQYLLTESGEQLITMISMEQEVVLEDQFK